MIKIPFVCVLFFGVCLASPTFKKIELGYGFNSPEKYMPIRLGISLEMLNYSGVYLDVCPKLDYAIFDKNIRAVGLASLGYKYKIMDFKLNYEMLYGDQDGNGIISYHKYGPNIGINYEAGIFRANLYYDWFFQSAVEVKKSSNPSLFSDKIRTWNSTTNGFDLTLYLHSVGIQFKYGNANVFHSKYDEQYLYSAFIIGVKN